MARKHHPERSNSIRKLIIDSALQICLEEGYNEVTVRRIGDRIGYSTGVIYYHFKDKQDILNNLDKRLDEETYTIISGMISPDRSLKENLDTLFSYTCKLAYNNPEAYKRIFTSSRIENNPLTRNLWIKLIYDCLSAAAERGEIPNDDRLELKAKNLLSFILGHNFLFYEFEKAPDIKNAAESCEMATQLIINGIINI
ncbi:MAG: TetR/AcrR family transcriptional regulator [Ruminococcaceae bacterium]|nr:TetR/AcrR family transcriptional regulator [Oscillospiraceae bacterium]